MRRVNVMLDQQTIEKASDIGSGNLSAGLRVAVSKYRKKKSPAGGPAED